MRDERREEMNGRTDPLNKLRLLPSALCLLSVGIASGQQTVVITCATEDKCEFLKVASFTVDGKKVIRLGPAVGKQEPGDLTKKNTREFKISALKELIRDLGTGAMVASLPSGGPALIVLPPRLDEKGPVVTLEAWSRATLEYRETLKSKNSQAVHIKAFAGMLNGADPEQAAVEFARRLVEHGDGVPRRNQLTRGAVEFAKSSTAYLTWRRELAANMAGLLKTFREQSGDPTKLADVLKQGIWVSDMLVSMAILTPEEQAARSSLRSSQESLLRKKSIAVALGAAGFADQAAAKIHEISLPKWSFPELQPLERNSLRAAAGLHADEARDLERRQLWLRAFDEAELASAYMPCDKDNGEYFKRVRLNHVDRNTDASGEGYSGEGKAILEQTAIELSGLGKDKAAYVLNRIETGHPGSRYHSQLQMLRAQNLLNLDRVAEARDVVLNVERNIRLNPEERKAWVQFDGNVEAKLTYDIPNSRRQVAQLIQEGKNAEALEKATEALRMAPTDSGLLESKARAEAFVRKNQAALETVRLHLATTNPACTEERGYTDMLNLLKALAGDDTVQEPEPGRGNPHWVSGKLYGKNGTYYDPISLGFFPRIDTVFKEKGDETFFKWEDYRIRYIRTSPYKSSTSVVSDGQETFYAEPFYAPRSVQMMAIGPRGTWEDPEKGSPLVYLNSKGSNVRLLSSIGQRQIARGWAGNPFFHPFYWRKVFLFDFVYDEKGRVVEARPVRPDVSQRADEFSQVLRFQWEDGTNRLLSVTGSQGYSRVLKYDQKGRLEQESIKYVKNDKGEIQYDYRGDEMMPFRAHCDSDIYEKQEKTVVFLRLQ
jgi:hypothetical protein